MRAVLEASDHLLLTALLHGDDIFEVTMAYARRARWVIVAMSTALVAGACSAGTSSELASPAAAVEPATTTTRATAATTTPLDARGATTTFAPPPVTYARPAGVGTGAAAVGITGAALPLLEVVSADFDADRVLGGAGSFPPLDDPAIVGANEATWLDNDALVLGAVQNGEARAYPIYMMRFHHVSNDELGGEPFLVTF